MTCNPDRMGKHRIAAYCEQMGLSHAEFAEEIGVTRQRVSQIINDISPPSPSLGKVIIDKSGGAITWSDLYDRPRAKGGA